MGEKMKTFRLSRIATAAGTLALILAACVLAVFLLRDSYYLLVLSLVAVWAVLGLSWNILGGYGGLISFGHAAFFGCGSYSVAILFHDYRMDRFLTEGIACLAAGLLHAGVAGLLLWLVLRRGCVLDPISAGVAAGTLWLAGGAEPAVEHEFHELGSSDSHDDSRSHATHRR